LAEHQAAPLNVLFAYRFTYELSGHVPLTEIAELVKAELVVGLMIVAPAGRGGAEITEEIIVAAIT
jgi:hypothetical protein